MPCAAGSQAASGQRLGRALLTAGTGTILGGSRAELNPEPATCSSWHTCAVGSSIP